MDSLRAYALAFDFVEINSTFYQTPVPSTVDSWAERVPQNFDFAIRCHRDLTHKFMLSPTEESSEILENGIAICRRLGSRLLVIETPRSFDPNKALLDVRDLLSSVSLYDIRPVWEIRCGLPGDELIRLMQDFDMVHCTDLSREPGPAFESDILYSRLFGHGWHNLYQFDDDELMEIDDRAQVSGAGSIYLSFHGGRMYKDAARLKKYKREGKFPGVTKHAGTDALREVLEEDARFPASRQELIDSQGWKVIDMPGDKRVHASVLLKWLDEELYGNADEVADKIKSYL